MSSQERVILVDDQDNPIGTEEKIAAHERGLLHRAFSVFIVRETPAGRELLLQQRAASKYHFGGLWTNTCCGHPREGEAVTAAGARRLQEEMGLRCALERVASFVYRAQAPNGLSEHELDHVLFGTTHAEPTPAPEEASDFRWIRLAELDAELAAAPERFSPWFAPALELVRDRL